VTASRGDRDHARLRRRAGGHEVRARERLRQPTSC
jgi:hypothetical protein